MYTQTPAEKTVLLDVVELGKLHKPNGKHHPETGESLTPMESAQIMAKDIGAFTVYISWSHEEVASHNSWVTRRKGRPSSESHDYRVAIIARVLEQKQQE